MSYNVSFFYSEKNQEKTKLYQNKSQNYLFKTLLREFLKDTNSKSILSTDQIAFSFNGRLINDEMFLDDKPNLTIRQVFKGNLSPTIQVFDTGNVIGGNHII